MILPIPGEDFHSWAEQLIAVLQPALANFENAGSLSGQTYYDGNKRVVLDGSGLYLYDPTGVMFISQAAVAIDTRHLVANAITSAKRQVVNTWTGSAGSVAAGALGTVTHTHNLGKIMMATLESSSATPGLFSVIQSSTINAITVATHNLSAGAATDTVTLRYW